MITLRFLALPALLAAVPALSFAQQAVDTAFNATVLRPAFAAGTGPVIVFDEAHGTFHRAERSYGAFTRLLRRDGYVVRVNASPFTRDALDSARVLVIVNPLHPSNQHDWYLPTPSAFTPDEIRTVAEWVATGGSLLLIADHMPFAGAAENLAAAFGIFFANGFAFDSSLSPLDLVFRRSDGSLASHPITNGRGPGERIDSIVTFTGSAFRVLVPAEPLVLLPPNLTVLMPEEAWLFSKRTPRLSAAGMLQGAVLRHGRGRVAVFGEAAMFSAQFIGTPRRPMGMNAPAAHQNAQFVLNVIHWLTDTR